MCDRSRSPGLLFGGKVEFVRVISGSNCAERVDGKAGGGGVPRVM